MQTFEITQEEKQFILKRREILTKRNKLRNVAPTNPPKAKTKDVILGENRPKGWDEHCSPCQIHKGRLTEEHPLYWFEERIFQKITNLQHKEQHKKIKTLLGLNVQNVFRDRQYHALAHLEALWQQQLLPLSYKIKAEEYKAKHKIGMDFVHPGHKKPDSDYVHPISNSKRPWDSSKYIESKDEAFVAGKKYKYAYDKEIGYKFEEAYKEEISVG